MNESVTGPTEQQGMPLNILLVEDNDADVKIALRTFHNAKLKNDIFVVNDGQECLDFVRHQGAYQDAAKNPRPDLILLDINMPRVDGIGVLKALKSDKDYCAIPIIVLSASKNQHDITQAYNNGANSFIQKPVSYEEFVNFIECFNHYWHVLNKLPARRT